MAAGDTVATNAYLPKGPGAANSMEFESLRNVVEMVAREETPLFTNINKAEADAMKMEWPTEDIGTVTAATNRKIGFVAAPTAEVNDRRLINYLQLMAEEGSLADATAKLPSAGGVNTLAHRKLKRGILLRRKVNKLMHTQQAYDSTITDPKMATIPAYCAANFKSVAATPGAAPAGTGADIPGAGTTPDDFFSIDPIDTVLETAYQTNGRPNALYVSPRMSRLFSRLPDAGVDEKRQTSSDGSYEHIGTIDKYQSDFGMIEKIMDIDAPNTQLMILDHDYVDMPIVPGLNFEEDELGKRGASTEFMIQLMATLRITLPEAHCYINGFKP